MFKKLTLLLIRVYQKTLSFDHGPLGNVFPNTRFCTMYPSCSAYTHQAIEKYGISKGITKGFFRILRCHPFQKNLIDYP